VTTIAAYDRHVQQLFDTIDRLASAFAQAGVDMLVDSREPRARSAVHLAVGEKVRPEYTEPVPRFSPAVRTTEGVPLIAVADLVRMKLTSFRLRDRVHLQDLDSVGLIANGIEAGLPPPLRERLRDFPGAGIIAVRA